MARTSPGHFALRRKQNIARDEVILLEGAVGSVEVGTVKGKRYGERAAQRKG